MKKCLEVGIDPKSEQAPKSMEEAKTRFFENHGNWDLPRNRKQQAESIQIIADGPKLNTSLIIYDDGEGQHPEDLRTLSCRCCTATRMKSTLYKANTIWAEAAQLCSAVKSVTS